MRSKTSLFLLLAGYLSSALVYFIWYYVIWHFPNYKKYATNSPNMEFVVVIASITVLYLFIFFLIWAIESLQTPWKSFLLISIITLLSFFIIPTGYLAKYEFTQSLKKISTKTKYAKELETALKNTLALNVAANNSIMELQTKLEIERNENKRLRKELIGLTKKSGALEKEPETKKQVAAIQEQAIETPKTNQDFPIKKMTSKPDLTDVDAKTEEIFFKVQVISSNTRLAIDSPSFKWLKNVSEYADNGRYKYTVGNQKDLKSASELQSQLRKKGFEGAFVVAFKNGKRIPIREAIKLLE